jgi:tRNA pseudouridine55 synthase
MVSNGRVLVIDKEEGPTSFDVVRSVKRLFPGEKVGHAGSLDPFATGVLVVLLGKATKLSGALLNADKRYLATVKLGEATDAMDRTGQVVETQAVSTLTREDIEKVLQDFQGEWMMIPPMFSAKKFHGVRLYELARQSIRVPRDPVPVQLYELKLLEWASPFLKFEVFCSKGTYVRSLADELARRLGTVGHLHDLRRVSCGGFQLAEAVTLGNLGQDKQADDVTGYRNYVRLLSQETHIQRSASTASRLPSYRSDGNKGAKLM